MSVCVCVYVCVCVCVCQQDLVDFLTNVECLEGQFDTYGTLGVGFNGEHHIL